jgi:hypothetical protein
MLRIDATKLEQSIRDGNQGWLGKVQKNKKEQKVQQVLPLIGLIIF